jgi:hypothetical protein
MNDTFLLWHFFMHYSKGKIPKIIV